MMVFDASLAKIVRGPMGLSWQPRAPSSSPSSRPGKAGTSGKLALATNGFESRKQRICAMLNQLLVALVFCFFRHDKTHEQSSAVPLRHNDHTGAPLVFGRGSLFRGNRWAWRSPALHSSREATGRIAGSLAGRGCVAETRGSHLLGSRLRLRLGWLWPSCCES
jgi:hypothetical protein